MKKFRMLVVMGCVAVLFGCAATGPKFQKLNALDAGKATVYLYRPDKFVGMAIQPPIYLNGEKLFVLKNGGYALLELKPGKHVLETRKGGSFFSGDAVGSAEFDVKPEVEYFIKWLPFMEEASIIPLNSTFVGYSRFSGNFYKMSEADALTEIAECKRLFP